MNTKCVFASQLENGFALARQIQTAETNAVHGDLHIAFLYTSYDIIQYVDYVLYTDINNIRQALRYTRTVHTGSYTCTSGDISWRKRVHKYLPHGSRSGKYTLIINYVCCYNVHLYILSTYKKIEQRLFKSAHGCVCVCIMCMYTCIYISIDIVHFIRLPASTHVNLFDVYSRDRFRQSRNPEP